MAWFLASTGWAAIAIDGGLFIAALGTQMPAWVFAVALAVQDAVFGWRLWLISRDRVRWWRRESVDEGKWS